MVEHDNRVASSVAGLARDDGVSGVAVHLKQFGGHERELKGPAKFGVRFVHGEWL
jgi:hypothetical protein